MDNPIRGLFRIDAGMGLPRTDIATILGDPPGGAEAFTAAQVVFQCAERVVPKHTLVFC